MTMQATGLFVYVKPLKKVGLLVDVQVIVQRVPQTGLDAQGILVQGAAQEMLVPLATVALKDAWWGGPLGETMPVWEETEMDSLGGGEDMTVEKFEADLAAAEAAARGEQDGSSEGDVQGAAPDGDAGAGDGSVPDDQGLPG